MAKELTLKEATEQQRVFIESLHSEELVKVPARQRFRWCATKAGYSETTPISQIVKPIRHLIIEAAEDILMRASISAAWVLSDIADGEEVDVIKSKLKLQAAESILDRVVPKKEVSKGNQAPLVTIMLPPKAVIKHAEEDE